MHTLAVVAGLLAAAATGCAPLPLPDLDLRGDVFGDRSEPARRGGPITISRGYTSAGSVTGFLQTLGTTEREQMTGSSWIERTPGFYPVVHFTLQGPRTFLQCKATRENELFDSLKGACVGSDGDTYRVSLM